MQESDIKSKYFGNNVSPDKYNMANKRKGQLTPSGEWAKHLRKFLKAKFWRAERKAGKVHVRIKKGEDESERD